MPSWNYAALSSGDFASVLAFVLSTPPVDKPTPPRKFGPKARAAIASGDIGFDADELAKAPVPSFDSEPDATPAYGKYLARVAGCQACHGVNLNGVQGFSPNLTPRAIGTWSATDFITTIRTGVTPGKRQLSDRMPWRVYTHMTNEELHALYAYLHSLPPS
jgi:mono/diheme cytochrome c family protein